MEKTGIAQFIDKIAEGLGKGKAETPEVANVLPKPITQDIGDGVIVWRWEILNGSITVESTLATREPNQAKLAKDEYVVAVAFPESDNATYCFYDDSAKDVGQAILSAWNWKEIWKLHAGDFLLEKLSQELPACEEREEEKTEEFDV